MSDKETIEELERKISVLQKGIDSREKTIKNLQKAIRDSCRLSFDSGYYSGRLLDKLDVAKAELEATEDYLDSLFGDNGKGTRSYRLASIRHTLKKIREEIIPQNNPVKNNEEIY